MVEMGKKTGGHFLWEPLRTELQDIFGALSHAAPDSVFSSLKGLENNSNSLSNDEDQGIINAKVNTNKATLKGKKQSKSTYNA